MEISASQLQQVAQGAKKSPKTGQSNSSTEFQGMIEMLSMLPMVSPKVKGNEGQVLSQEKEEIQDLSGIQKRVIDHLIATADLKKLNLDSIEQDILLKLKDLFTSQDQQSPFQVIEGKEGESIQRILQQLVTDEESSIGSMLPMVSPKVKGNEGQVLSQEKEEIQDLSGIQKRVIDQIEHLIATTDLKKLNLDSVDQDILLKLKDLFTSQDQQSPFQAIEGKEGESIRKLLQQLVNGKESSIASEFAKRMDNSSLDKTLSKLQKVEHSLRENIENLYTKGQIEETKDALFPRVKEIDTIEDYPVKTKGKSIGSMLSRTPPRIKGNEGKILSQEKTEVQDLSGIQKRVIDQIEHLIATTDLKKLNLDSIEQDILLKSKDLLTSQEQQSPFEAIEGKEGESIQRILKQLVNGEESSISSELVKKMDNNSLGKVLSEILPEFGEMEKASKKPSRDLSMENQSEKTKEELLGEFRTSRRMTKQDFQESKGSFIEGTEEKNFSFDAKENFQKVPKDIKEKSVSSIRLKTKDGQQNMQDSDFSYQIINLSKNSGEMQSVKSQVEVQNMQHIANQMIEEIQVLKEGQHSSLQVRLRPEELGEIEIHLKMKEGKVVGEITVESLSAKGAMEGQLQSLKERLSHQNISLHEVNINLQENDQGQSQQRGRGFFDQNHQSHKGFSEEISQEEEVSNDPVYAPVSLKKSYYTNRISNSLNLLA